MSLINVVTDTFNILSLCSGIGGLELGVKLAERDACTVCYVEIEAYNIEILATRMEEKSLDEAPIWSDLRTFDGKPWRGVVDCITAGYPCQPFSVAGKQRGEDDPRHLWPEVCRVVGEVQPSVCFFENVGGHLRLGFEQVHDDLQAMGYQVKAGLFTAEEVGAPHRRERLFIMAYREGERGNRWLRESREVQGEARERVTATSEGSSEKLGGVEYNGPSTIDVISSLPFPYGPNESWEGIPRKLEPSICRMDDGLAYRVDRLRTCGNAVVPLVAAHAWNTLKEKLQ